MPLAVLELLRETLLKCMRREREQLKSVSDFPTMSPGHSASTHSQKLEEHFTVRGRSLGLWGGSHCANVTRDSELAWLHIEWPVNTNSSGCSVKELWSVLLLREKTQIKLAAVIKYYNLWEIYVTFRSNFVHIQLSPFVLTLETNSFVKWMWMYCAGKAIFIWILALSIKKKKTFVL